MDSEFRIELSAQLSSSSLSKLNEQIKGLKVSPIKIQINTSEIDNHVLNIKKQLQSINSTKVNPVKFQNQSAGAATKNNNSINNNIKLLEDYQRRIYALDKKVINLKVSGNNSNSIKTYSSQIDELKSKYNELYSVIQKDLSTSQMDKLNQQIKKNKDSLSDLELKLTDVAKKSVLNFDTTQKGNTDKITKDYERLEIKTKSVTKAFQEFKNATNNMNAAKVTGDNEKIINSYNQYKEALKNVTAEIRNSNNLDSLSSKRMALDNYAKTWLKNHSAAADEFGSKINAIRAKIKDADSATLNNLKGQLTAIISEAKSAGAATQSFGDKLKSQLSKLGVYFSAVTLITKGAQTVKDMARNTLDVNTAMTELYRVTDLSKEQYEGLYDGAVESAKEYGVALDNIISSTASWIRLGFNENEASKLAEITGMYQHVTDLDEETAVKNLVTAYKGYQNELLAITNGDAPKAVEMIADIFDKLGNETPVSASQVAEGLTRWASVAEQAGASIEEASALIVGGGAVTQDFDQMGAALKIATLRIRGMKGELEALGEEVDDNIVGTSKMQTQILNLTKGKVNIFEDDGKSFRNVYDIFKDISTIWNDLAQTDQASLLELIAGKNRSNSIQALVTHWGDVEAAVKVAYNAEGTAREEQGKYMKELQGNLDSMKSSYQALSKTVINSDFLIALTKSGTSLLNILDSIVGTLGTFPTLIGAITAALSGFKNFGRGKLFPLYKYAKNIMCSI